MPPVLRFGLVLLFLSPVTPRAESLATLPGTSLLPPSADFSAEMVAGIDRFALREIAKAKATRVSLWPGDATAHRAKLAVAIGATDTRLPIKAFELVGDTLTPAVVADFPGARVLRVRWPVLSGFLAEGLLIQPKDAPLARIVVVPDADASPEQIAADPLLLYSGCEILIPALISRDSTASRNDRFGVKTNVTHREWIYRQTYLLGRHIIGYEVQSLLSAVDLWSSDSAPVAVVGSGEGGMLALIAGALDPRIDGVYVGGYFGPREGVWAEPLYRSVSGLLAQMGDAEMASLIAPRLLVIQSSGFPQVPGPPKPRDGQRDTAAPGALGTPDLAGIRAEVARAQSLRPGAWLKHIETPGHPADSIAHLLPAQADAVAGKTKAAAGTAAVAISTDPSRQERLVRRLEALAQSVIVPAETHRDQQFWKPLPLTDLSAYEAHTAGLRQQFWEHVIGRFTDPDAPMQPQTQLIRETEKVRLYEVKLGVWDDVFAWGWLALPRDLKDGEKNPVVVCQHGLEGIPEDVFNDDPQSNAYKPYKAFALQLAERGYITFAPHNPYRGMHTFRSLQRKLNPIGKTLFSVIIGQHQRILEWLKQQPFTDPQRIAFYGLSYGGKSAMRVPAVLPDYCLSICSGDFNEWVRKCVSNELPMSYIHTHEYEIWEWDLGHTYNYAEMAALIAPRPFMVERGHNDGVGIDEWVNYEFAKVRRLYEKLKIGHRTQIEHFDGPHEIHGVGTFQFLDQHLAQKR